MPDKPNGSPTREQPVKVVAPRPASTVAGALKTSQSYLDKAK